MPPRSHRISLSLKKLSKFSDIHLMELSTDIYDELRRRQNPNSLPGENLPIKAGIHPQRNDARRKLGSLSYERFGDMCKDIVAEQERRYPHLAVQGGGIINEFIDEPEVKDSFAPQGIAATTPRLETFGSPYPGNDLVASPVVNRGSLQFSVDSERSNPSIVDPGSSLADQHLMPGAIDPQDEHTAPQQIVQTSVSHVKTQMMLSDSGSESDEELDFQNRVESSLNTDADPDHSPVQLLEPNAHASSRGMRPVSALSALSAIDTGDSHRPAETHEHSGESEDLEAPVIPDRYDSRSPHGASSEVDYEDIEDDLDMISRPLSNPNAESDLATTKPTVSFMFDDEVRDEPIAVEHNPKRWSTALSTESQYNERDESEDDLNEEPNMGSNAYRYQRHSYGVPPQEEEKEGEAMVEQQQQQQHQHPGVARELQDSEADADKSIEDSLENSLSANSQELHLLKSRLEEAEQRLAAAELRAEKAELETAAAIKRAELAESNDATSTLELTGLKDEKTSLSNKLLTLESQISELQQAARVEQQKSAAAELHASQAEHALAEAKERAAATNDQLQALKDSHREELTRSRETAANTDAAASSDLQLVTKQRNNLEEEHSALKEQLEALQIIVREQHEDLTRAPTVHRNADEVSPMARSIEQPGTPESSDAQLVKDYSELQLRYEHIKEELASQQAITERVRQEAAMFLDEMRELAQRQADEAKEKVTDGARIDELTAQVKKSTIEAQEWRMKYVDSLCELKKLRDIHRSSMLPSALRFLGGPEIHKSDGLLSGTLVVELQSALDDFLLNAREDKRRGEILSDLHRVILATRGIVAEAKAHDPKYADAVKLVSRTANQMISVVRNFSVSSGLLPLTLVDAACSDLAVSVIELVKMAGIRDTTASPVRSGSPIRHSMHFEDSPLTKTSYAATGEHVPVHPQQRKKSTSVAEPQTGLSVPRTRPSYESIPPASRYASGSSSPFTAVPAIPPPQVPEGERWQVRESMIKSGGTREINTPPGPPNTLFSQHKHDDSVSPAPSMAESMSFDQIVMGTDSPAEESLARSERAQPNSRQEKYMESYGTNISPNRNQTSHYAGAEKIKFGESLSPLKPGANNPRSPPRKPVPSQEFSSPLISHRLSQPDEHSYSSYIGPSSDRRLSHDFSTEPTRRSSDFQFNIHHQSHGGERSHEPATHRLSADQDERAVFASIEPREPEIGVDRSLVDSNLGQEPNFQTHDSHMVLQSQNELLPTEAPAPAALNIMDASELNIVSAPEPEPETVHRDEHVRDRVRQDVQGDEDSQEVQVNQSNTVVEAAEPNRPSTPDSFDSLQHSRELDVSPAKSTREVPSPKQYSTVQASHAPSSKDLETSHWITETDHIETHPETAGHRGSFPESTVIRAPERRQPTAVSPSREIKIDASVAKLQQYLEEQTSETIEATSSLLSGIKENATAGVLKPLIDKIIEFVNEMINATGSTMGSSTNTLLRTKGRFIVENLRDCSQRMDAIYDEIHRQRDDSKLNRATKQRLAGCAFDMAKCTKELVKTVEEVTLMSELEQIDMTLV